MKVFEKELLRAITYHIPKPDGSWQSFSCSADDLRWFHDTGNRMLSHNISIPLPLEHQREAVPMTPAEKLAANVLYNGGWVKDFFFKKDGSLWFRAEIDPSEHVARRFGVSKDELENKLESTIRFVSPWIKPEFRSGDGQTWRNCITHVALTNSPIWSGQKPFSVPGAPSSMEAALSLCCQDGICFSLANAEMPISEKEEKHGDAIVRFVNAKAIRDSSLTHEEFGDLGTHVEFPDMIPKGEVWISDTVHEDDKQVTIDTGLAQLKADERGESKDKAVAHGISVGKHERQKRDGKKSKPKKVPKDIYVSQWEVPEEKKKELDPLLTGVSVFIVDTHKVRDEYQTAFVEGSNHEAESFVPENEIWISDEVVEEEIPAVVKHEATERKLMKGGMKYKDAHPKASKAEFADRESEESGEYDDSDSSGSLDRLGGEMPVVSKAKLKEADFITYPEDVNGSNCGNCMFNRAGVCRHHDLDGQPVSPRNCCGYWNAPGTLREWKGRDGEVYMSHNGRSYACAMIPVSDAVAAAVRDFGLRIPDAELADDGREDKVHVTLKYGLEDSAKKKLQKALGDVYQFPITVGGASLFRNPNYDVLKLEILSPELMALNGRVDGQVPHIDTYDFYSPHVTVAYLKPGFGHKYVGPIPGLTGAVFTATKVDFSDTKDKHTEINLQSDWEHPPTCVCSQCDEAKIAARDMDDYDNAKSYADELNNPSTDSLEKSAQAWTKPATQDRVMDPELATEFAKILDGVKSDLRDSSWDIWQNPGTKKWHTIPSLYMPSPSGIGMSRERHKYERVGTSRSGIPKWTSQTGRPVYQYHDPNEGHVGAEEMSEAKIKHLEDPAMQDRLSRSVREQTRTANMAAVHEASGHVLEKEPPEGKTHLEALKEHLGDSQENVHKFLTASSALSKAQLRELGQKIGVDYLPMAARGEFKPEGKSTGMLASLHAHLTGGAHAPGTVRKSSRKPREIAEQAVGEARKKPENAVDIIKSHFEKMTPEERKALEGEVLASGKTVDDLIQHLGAKVQKKSSPTAKSAGNLKSDSLPAPEKPDVESDTSQDAAMLAKAQELGKRVAAKEGAPAASWRSRTEPALAPSPSSPEVAAVKPEHVKALTDFVSKTPHNFAKMGDVRAALEKAGVVDAAHQDAVIQRSRKDGLVSAGNIEGREGISPEEKSSALREKNAPVGEMLGHLIMRTPQPKTDLSTDPLEATRKKWLGVDEGEIESDEPPILKENPGEESVPSRQPGREGTLEGWLERETEKFANTPIREFYNEQGSTGNVILSLLVAAEAGVPIPKSYMKFFMKKANPVHKKQMESLMEKSMSHSGTCSCGSDKLTEVTMSKQDQMAEKPKKPDEEKKPDEMAEKPDEKLGEKKTDAPVDEDKNLFDDYDDPEVPPGAPGSSDTSGIVGDAIQALAAHGIAIKQEPTMTSDDLVKHLTIALRALSGVLEPKGNETPGAPSPNVDTGKVEAEKPSSVIMSQTIATPPAVNTPAPEPTVSKAEYDRVSKKLASMEMDKYVARLDRCVAAEVMSPAKANEFKTKIQGDGVMMSLATESPSVTFQVLDELLPILESQMTGKSKITDPPVVPAAGEVALSQNADGNQIVAVPRSGSSVWASIENNAEKDKAVMEEFHRNVGLKTAKKS